MDSAERELEQKCENLMNVVVETRKQFGKKCVDYAQNASILENKMLNLQIERFSKFKYKTKPQIPVCNDADGKETEGFTKEILARTKRIEELRSKLKSTTEVVAQLKCDTIGRRLREPLTADILLAKAKSRKVS